jgi:hypothetical protein
MSAYLLKQCVTNNGIDFSKVKSFRQSVEFFLSRFSLQSLQLHVFDLVYFYLFIRDLHVIRLSRKAARMYFYFNDIDLICLCV